MTKRVEYERVQFSVRAPVELHKRLLEDAARNMRTLNAEVVYQLTHPTYRREHDGTHE